MLAEPRTYPDWLVGAQRIRGVDADFPSQGAEFDHSVGPTSATTIDDSTEVLLVDRPSRLTLLARVGPLHAQVDMLLEPTPGGCVVRFRERPAGWAMALTPFLRPPSRPATSSRSADSRHSSRAPRRTSASRRWDVSDERVMPRDGTPSIPEGVSLEGCSG